MIETGSLLAGKYRVERVLGKGGMGYVVAALHTQLDQRVAVKLLMPELAQLDEPVARFLREARAAVRIRSEHVARVIDVGTLDDGTPFMVMEYLEGNDLADELDVRGELPVEQAVDYVLQASEAIAEAHSLGIVHRDLKPANLFLTHRPDGSALIKVLDFGISKALLADELANAPSLTATQSLIGSPYYMSPEQVRRPRDVDARTDIWSLGVILYELLTGRLPFIADTAMSVLAAVVSDPPPPLRDARADLPEQLGEIVGRCLEKEPARRYQHVAELARALEPFASELTVPLVSRIAGMRRSSLTPRSLGPVPAPRSDAVPELETVIDGEDAARERHDSQTPPPHITSSSTKLSPALRGSLVAGVALALGCGLWLAASRTGPKVVPETVSSEPAAPPPPSLGAAASQVLPSASAFATEAKLTASSPTRADAGERTPQAVPIRRGVVRTAPRKAAPQPKAPSAPSARPAAPLIDPLEGRR